LHVTALYRYPVKGAAGTALDTARLDDFGIAWDRRWLVVDAVGRFITAREHPRMLQLRTALDAAVGHAHSDDVSLVLHSDTAGVLRVPIGGPDGSTEEAAAPAPRVRIWHDDVAARDEGDAAASFVSAHLGFAARLVFMPDTTLRQVDTGYARDGDRVSFADAFPLLLAGQASLDAVNRRLDAPIPMLRFRPNVVVATDAPHVEDTWRRIRIGDVACDVVKPCARCVVTTLDPATLAPSKEPLRALSAYRQWDGKTWFGQNAIHRGTGCIAIGARVEVVEAGEARPPLPPAR
jgi:uncharacterized protein